MRDISDVQSPSAKGHDSHLHVDGAAPGRQSAALEPMERQAVAKNAHVWKRDELDWYVEPEWVSDVLFAVEQFEEQVFDPACGAGNICSAAARAGVTSVGGSDLVKRCARPQGWHWFGKLDFLCGELPRCLVGTTNIVTNPPFFRAKGTEAFARKALSLATRKVAIFASLPFLASQRRANGLYAEFPPARVWVLAERPSCPPGEMICAGHKPKGGTEDWCWLVWDKTAPVGETRLGWLRRAK